MANSVNKQLRQSQAQAASAEAKHPGSSSEGGTAAAQLGDSGVTAHSTARKISGGQDSVPEHHRHPPAQAAARPFGASFAVVEPETPSPVNRRDPLAPDSSCSSSDEEVSFERGRKRSLESSRGYEAAALAAARARAADDRAALAEAALAAAQDRASAAEAAHTESLTESARQALRIAELEKQLLEMQLKLSSSEGAARGGGCDRGAESQHTSIVDSAHSAGTAPAVGGAAAQQDQDGGNDTEDDAENAEPMDLWPPPGLRGCELDFCADGEAAADAERAARLTEQVTALETDVESQSERLTAAFARMAAMCDMVQGAAKIAFSGNDLSARRLRHHIFQALDMDADGFLGEADLEHWYGVNRVLLDTGGFEAVSLEQVRQQLCDALHDASLPPAFASWGKVSMLQLVRSRMGAGIVSIMLNLGNLMQERSTAEWGATSVVTI